MNQTADFRVLIGLRLTQQKESTMSMIDGIRIELEAIGVNPTQFQVGGIPTEDGVTVLSATLVHALAALVRINVSRGWVGDKDDNIIAVIKQLEDILDNQGGVIKFRKSMERDGDITY